MRQTTVALATQDIENRLDFLAQQREIRFAGGGSATGPRRFGDHFIETVTRAADGESLVVEQVAYAPDQKHFVVLVVTAVAAPLDRLELRKLLLPISQHVRLDAAQLAHFADGEIALRRDRRQRFLRTVACFHYCSFVRPSPLVFVTREKSLRAVR